MKKILSLLLCCALCLSASGCFLKDTRLNDFYDKISESQELLDIIADDIYQNWYDAIYNDDFNEDINLAVASALSDNEENMERIEVLDAEITELFKDLKDSKNGELVKDIMEAYSDYYEFVINVSGSFNSYSADKEALKKELASLLKDLSYEL